MAEPVILTDAAITRFKNLIEAQKNTHNTIVGFVLGVSGKGCHGFSYDLNVAKEVPANHLVMPIQDGYNLYVDEAAIPLIQDTVIDYHITPFQSSFVFKNPNETSRCGCGESFNV